MPLRARDARGRVAKVITVAGNLRIACDQFNAGQYYDCHETLEEIWQEEAGEVRDLYKGLIQLAAAFVHLSRANYAGAERLLRTAAEYLETYRPAALGFDIERIAPTAVDCRARLLELGPGRAADFDLATAPHWDVDEAALAAESIRWRAWGFTREGLSEPMTIEVIE